jgi:hypothetical protein
VRYRRPPHAQIHLPPLTANEALLLVNLLDHAIAALWRTHGDAMAELLACLDRNAVDRTAAAPAHAPGDHDDLF